MTVLPSRMFRESGRATVLLFSLTIPLFLSAQSAPVASAKTPLSATAVEVSLDLAVHTKHNKPVLDLQPGQLAVTDDGSPVQLTSLRLVASASGPQHLLTLVFDRLDAGSAKRARKAAEKILSAIPEKGYSFAVFQVDGRLRLLQPYTVNRALVEAAVGDATPAVAAAETPGLTAAEKTLRAAAPADALNVTAEEREQKKLMLAALEQSQRILEDRHSYPSLAALQALVLSDRFLTGRKFIFYFSSGLALNSDGRDILHSIVALANRAGVTLCVVDTNPFNPQINSALEASEASSILGEVGSNSGITGAGMAPGAGGFSPGAVNDSVHVHDIAGFQSGDMNAEDGPLVTLASGTGGLYIGASGASKGQLRQIRNDLTAWYQASWVPPIRNYDGQFREIRIRPLRKGLVIRARSGYYAVPPTEAAEVRPFEMPLLNLLTRPTLPTDIAFHTAVLHLGHLADGNSGDLVVQVPLSQLTIREDANTHISTAHASIAAVILDSKGAVLQHFGQDFPLHEAADMMGRDSGQSFTLQEHFSAEPGAYTLEAVVMDRLSNRAGAQRSTFTIEPAAQGPGLSDIALVDSIEPAQDDSQNFEPMRYGDGLVVPSLEPSLPAQTSSLSLFFLLHPVGGSAEQPVLHMQIVRNGRVLTEMPMELRKVSGTGAAVPYLATLHTRVFPPGQYAVKALLTQDGHTVSKSVSFEVAGVARGSNADAGTEASAGGSVTAAGSSSAEGIDARLISEASTANSRFDITSPAHALPAPPKAEVDAMLEGARERALGWTQSLQNFFCLEITNHLVDATGHGDWKSKGTLVERMKYVDHQETRTTLLLNGEPSNVHPDRLEFFHSSGEFGAVFHIVFDPGAKAAFHWKQSAVLDGRPLQVFAFQVARANSSFYLSDRGDRMRTVGFHGLLYLDPSTRTIVRISIDVDDIPAALRIRACSLSVDYSWISMQNHDFLLPVRGAVSLQETRSRPVLNEFEFRDYHRFGSQIRVLRADEALPPAMH